MDKKLEVRFFIGYPDELYETFCPKDSPTPFFYPFDPQCKKLWKKVEIPLDLLRAIVQEPIERQYALLEYWADQFRGEDCKEELSFSKRRKKRRKREA